MLPLVKRGDYFEFRFLMVMSLFLLLSQALMSAVGLPTVQQWFGTVTGSHLTGEIAIRLSGVRYLILVALVVFVSWQSWKLFVLRYAKPKGLFILQPRWLQLLVLTLVLTVLVSRPDIYGMIFRGETPFFVCDCASIETPYVDKETLVELDPSGGRKTEARFFLSLAEFLHGMNSAQNSSPL